MNFSILTLDDTISDFTAIIKSQYKHIEILNLNNIDHLSDIITQINLAILPQQQDNKQISFLKKELANYDIPIIFIVDEHSEVLNDHNFGIYDFMVKPLIATDVVEKIKFYYKNNGARVNLDREKELTQTLMNTTQNPIFLTDGINILNANKAFKRLIANTYLADETLDFLKVKSLFTKHDNTVLKDSWILDTINNESKVSIKTKHHKESTYILKNRYLKLSGLYLIYLNDITHELEYELERLRLLYTDNLTKAPNRIKLIDELKNGELEIKSISIIDINSFKEINDFYGNKIGDEIIYGVCNIIKSYIEPYSSLALYKFPADTYCIINLSDNKEQFTNIIKEIVEIIDRKVFTLESYDINTQVTAGISFSEKNNKLITADLALQAAKKDHKDYLVFYDELDNIKEYKNNMHWTNKIKNALSNDGIVVYFQPLINNKTLNIDKYECLVRMLDDDKVVSPYFFLDISKKSNQYQKITRVVIEKSCRTFENLPNEFSVNISYEDIVEAGFLEFIKEVTVKYSVQNKIVFEILEDQSIKDYSVLIDFIEEVKKIGCKVAIDDFGSGYSNFEHILKMNVDYLKIDASLIKNIAKDENSYKVTRTIIDFANSLNLKTIAEFVENKEIFDIVKQLGADYSQGYYFSAPLEMPTYKLIDGNVNE